MGLKIKRPIIWLTIAYIVGILIKTYIAWRREYIHISLFIILIIALILGLFGNLKKLRRKGLFFLLFLSSFTLMGMANTYMSSIPKGDLDEFIEQEIILKGQVLEFASQNHHKTSFILELSRIDHEDKKYFIHNEIKATVYLDPENEEFLHINVGDWIEMRGRIKTPQGIRNPKGFDYRAYLARRDIHYTIGVPSKDIISIKAGRFSPPKSWIMGIRRSMAEVYDQYVRGDESKLIKAMIIGERWGLPSELKDQFANTGVAHILAISGLHVGFIILLLHWITRRLTLSPRVTFFVQGIVLGFYCLIVGGHASIVRATIMSIIILGGRVVGRKSDPLNSLSLAALIILLFNPLQLFEVGFQLSFGAVLGIVLFNHPIRQKLSWIPEKLGVPMAVMIGAQLGTWTLLAYYFNIFSPISFLANLILIPIAGLIVILGLLLLLVAAVIPILAGVLGWWLWGLCNILIYGNAYLSGFPWASLKVVSPGILFMVTYYIILFILSEECPSWIRKPWHLSGALAIIILLSISLGPIVNNDLKVVFVDVGQGDCIYIRTPEGKHILVDGGGKPPGMGEFDVGREIVVPFLLKNGVGNLDLVAMSHVHDDHIGGLIPVLESVDVESFMEFPPREITDKYRELKAIVEKERIQSIQALGGQSYRVGKDVFIDIIYPVADSNIRDALYDGDENNLSLVMRLRYKDTSIMLTGDTEEGVESYLGDIWDDEVSILKVAHHGSNTSSTAEFLEIINPEIAVIQSGKSNNFGHPNPLVLERLEEQGAKIYRNDIQGAVTCLYKKGQWQVKTIITD